MTPPETATPSGNGESWPGLSWRAVDQFAREFEQWIGRHAPSEGQLKYEIRHRLAAAGVPPDVLDTEVGRVLRELSGAERERL